VTGICTGMDEREREARLDYAIRHTRVVRPPRQALATFGTTIVRYHLVCEPVYAELDVPCKQEETVVRDGTVRAERPQVVTPSYLSRLEGFGENAQRYLEQVVKEHGPHAPGLLYTYKNEFSGTSIVSGAVREVAGNIGSRLDREDRRLEAVIRGVDELWDVSLLKFIFDLTTTSARTNVSELHAKGLLETRGGVPQEARRRIEQMLEDARRGDVDPAAVHRELERWGLFEEYQDRFLRLFRRR